eukprot:269515_1
MFSIPFSKPKKSIVVYLTSLKQTCVILSIIIIIISIYQLTQIKHIHTINYITKINNIQLNETNAWHTIFSNCAFNNTTNNFECPLGINYYYYFLNDTSNNLRCYWIENSPSKSLWKCEHNDDTNTNIMKPKQISECAVIFSSSSLLLNKYGKEIDSHSQVYRISYPPIKGYEKYAGSKTTVHVVCFGQAQMAMDDEKMNPKIFWKKNITFITFPVTMKNTGFYNRHHDELNTTWILTDGKIFSICNELYATFVHGKYCSTGMVTLIYALMHCHGVDLYGFSDDKCLPPHYYGKHAIPKRKCPGVLYREARAAHYIDDEHNIIKQISADYDSLNIIAL